MMRSKVGLPDPDLPSKATISPSFSVKSTCSSTCRAVPSAARNDLPTSCNSIRTLGFMSTPSGRGLRPADTACARKIGSTASRTRTSRQCPARCGGNRPARSSA
ncbi:hypothetical protein G6F62_014874 [Rhizopus arrhizus]|nr:hypothetical protein G6F62_014874 [Rhizopus arrhizus]